MYTDVLLTKPHIIMSASNPMFQSGALKSMTMDPHSFAVMYLCDELGLDVYTIEGCYNGVSERSIFIYEIEQDGKPFRGHFEDIKKLAKALGQETILESDGERHALIYLNQPKIVQGFGTMFFESTKNQDNWSKFEDGTAFRHILIDTLAK